MSYNGHLVRAISSATDIRTWLRQHDIGLALMCAKVSDIAGQGGWHDRIKDEGSQIEVIARHNRTTRMPRGNEFVRNLQQGKHLGTPVEEVRHEWLVLRDGHQVGFMAQDPSGSFHIGSLWSSRHNTQIMQAAVQAARSVMGPPKNAPEAITDTGVDTSALPPRI